MLYKETLGFTLIELIIVIIVIAVLVVTGAPRLLTGSSFSSYTQQQDVIAELRRVQQLAMNNSDRCYRTVFSPNTYFSQHLESDCSSVVLSDPALDIAPNVSLRLLNDNSESFSLYFDYYGRSHYTGNNGAGCVAECIAVDGLDALVVSISSEGYIYAP